MRGNGDTQLVCNPVVDIRRADDGPDLIISSCSAVRGFIASALRPGQPGYATALALMNGDVPDPGALSPMDAGPLWASALLILPQEQVPAFAPPSFNLPPEPFRQRGFMEIPFCISPEMVGFLAGHYQAQVGAGTATLQANGPDRHIMNDDPAGRVVLRALLPAVQAMVGTTLRPSYSFASLYRRGASMVMHRDQVRCTYTLSVAIDHQPSPADGIAPWPLTVDPGNGEPLVDCLLPLGGGLLFRGRELRHGRKPLVADQSSWTLLLHYVDSGSEEILD